MLAIGGSVAGWQASYGHLLSFPPVDASMIYLDDDIDHEQRTWDFS